MEEIERWAFRNTWSRSSIKQTGSKSQAILATGIVRSAGWRGSMEETNKAGRIDPSKGSYFVTNWSYRGFMEDEILLPRPLPIRSWNSPMGWWRREEPEGWICGLFGNP
jgi:hypothetical protein